MIVPLQQIRLTHTTKGRHKQRNTKMHFNKKIKNIIAQTLETLAPDALQNSIQLIGPPKSPNFGDYTIELPRLAALTGIEVARLQKDLPEKFKNLDEFFTTEITGPYLNLKIKPAHLRMEVFSELVHQPISHCIPWHLEYIRYFEFLSVLGHSPESARQQGVDLPVSDVPLLLSLESELNLLRLLMKLPLPDSESHEHLKSLIHFYREAPILHKNPIVTRSRLALLGCALSPVIKAT